MISIDGIFLFKLYALSNVYELFINKHLVLEIQNSKIDTCYKLYWYRMCSVICGGDMVFELIEFCRDLFESFFFSRKLVFKNKKYSAQVFNYTTIRDNENGFNVKRFINFLNSETKSNNNDLLNCLRKEIVSLLMHVLQIQAQSEKKNLIISFNGYKPFKNIFKYISIQYEYVYINDSVYNIYAYENLFKTLDFNIKIKEKIF